MKHSWENIHSKTLSIWFTTGDEMTCFTSNRLLGFYKVVIGQQIAVLR